ncbi:MAG TPA: glucosamine-6-phosphate deaminase [Candidatus Sulfotelmatobacter sp.]|jgi:glucosamine-6-phosphate deaminase|nr:glucosamine-6-phosphate deaminase [Candidatus Sulfotelmatobacter sp.]
MTNPNTKSFNTDRLQVKISSTRAEMGAIAAVAAAEILRSAIQRQGFARIIVASAPSQNELIAGLAMAPGIDWSRVTVFHMDEYVGISESNPASFRNYQQRHLLNQVKPAVFVGIRGEMSDPEAECARYSVLLAEAPVDLVCMGVGENGHIAFNDPPVADFADPKRVKVVELDDVCRQQQVNDGCFPDFKSVPRQAITLTCSMLMSGRALVCVVPGSRKAAAVAAMLDGKISTACPASILRQHPSATLFLDTDSASKIPNLVGN